MYQAVTRFFQLKNTGNISAEFRSNQRTPTANNSINLNMTYYRPRTYVRREVMFSQVCVCSTLGGGGYPIPGLAGGTPSQFRGVPPWTRSGWGIPPDLGQDTPPPTRSGWGPPPDLGQGTPPRNWDGVPPGPGTGTRPHQVWIRQSSTASTCYAAGGVPLAFTQEDFLVFL